MQTSFLSKAAFLFPNMRLPYTYSMPEAFMGDISVPAHWRLLGILNGFWLNNKDVYATNEWLSKQLKCSPRTVSDAVKTLENMGLATCIRQRNSRVIKRGDSNQLLSPSQPTAIPDSNQLLDNADTNADKDIAVAAFNEIRVQKYDPDKEDFSETPKQRKEKKQLLDAYDKMIAWAEKERGFPFLKTAKIKQYSAFKIARENGVKAEQLRERWIEFQETKFWQDNGFDWMNVVTSFNKRA